MNLDGISSSSYGSDSLGNARASSMARSAEAAKVAAAEARESGDTAKVDDVAEKFEALLSTMLVKEMRKALPNGVFGQGAGADVFEGWFDEHLGAALANGGDGLDLAGVIKANLGVKSDEAVTLPADGFFKLPKEDA